MIEHHTRMMNDISALKTGSLTSRSPMQMSEPKAQMLETLRMASPADFDLTYKRGQIAAHEEAQRLHRSYAALGDNEE